MISRARTILGIISTHTEITEDNISFVFSSRQRISSTENERPLEGYPHPHTLFESIEFFECYFTKPITKSNWLLLNFILKYAHVLVKNQEILLKQQVCFWLCCEKHPQKIGSVL